jgi:ABC-type Fe3+ transport system permease subunit
VAKNPLTPKPDGYRMRAPRALTLLPLLTLVVFGGVPLLLLAVASFFPDGSFSPSAYFPVLPGGGSYPYFMNSLLLAFFAALLSTTIGIVPGVVLGRTDLPRKQAWGILFTLPLLLPPMLMAAGWHPWVDGWLRLAGGSTVARMLGASAVLAFIYFPIPLFLTTLAVRRTDASLEDVATLYAGRRRALFTLVLRLARPGLSLAWLLVFLLTLAEETIPELFGLQTYPAHLRRLGILDEWRRAAPALLPLIVAALLIAAAEARLFGERGVAFLARGFKIGHRMFPLGITPRHLVQIFFCFLGVLTFGFPMLGWLLAIAGEGASAAVAALTAAWRGGAGAFARSLIFALAGGTLAVVLGVPLAYAAERSALPRRRVVDLFLVLLFVLPGPVLAYGLLHLFPLPFFRESAAALLLATGVHFAVVAYRMERVALRNLGERFEEAGVLAGASWSQRVQRLLLPLNGQFAGAVWLGVVLLAFRDGGIATALPPALPTLAELATRAGRTSPTSLAALALVAALLATFCLTGAATLARRLHSSGRIADRPPASSLPPAGARLARTGP